MPRKIPVEIQEQVCQRADFLCEYCHTNERWQYVRFTIDHISPVSESGEVFSVNLSYRSTTTRIPVASRKMLLSNLSNLMPSLEDWLVLTT